MDGWISYPLYRDGSENIPISYSISLHAAIPWRAVSRNGTEPETTGIDALTVMLIFFNSGNNLFIFSRTLFHILLIKESLLKECLLYYLQRKSEIKLHLALFIIVNWMYAYPSAAAISCNRGTIWFWSNGAKRKRVHLDCRAGIIFPK